MSFYDTIMLLKSEFENFMLRWYNQWIWRKYEEASR